jgi:hypothetical protein
MLEGSGMNLKRIKKWCVWIVSLVVVFILTMTWFYPYSSFSINKAYTYKPDPFVVDQYTKEVQSFKETFEKDFKTVTSTTPIDYTVNITQYILPLFEQKWLLSNKPLSIKKSDLEEMLFDVKNTRDTLLSLLEKEDYTSDERYYLVMNIKGLLKLEESIVNIQTRNDFTRKDLRILLHNLNVYYMSNFDSFTTFYTIYQDEEL